MEVFSTVSIKLARVVLLAVFAGEVWVAATQPITSAEALAYDRFVRPNIRESLHQPSVNSDVLYTLLEKRSVGLFHVSEISLRLPALLAGGFYLWALWRLGRLKPPAAKIGRATWVVLLFVMAVLPLAWRCFSTANGLGLALTLAVWAIVFSSGRLGPAGVCLGLAVASHEAFVIPAVFIAAYVAWRNREWHLAVERSLIPAVVTAFIVLVLPLALSPETPVTPPELTASEVKGVRGAVEMLRGESGTRSILVAASAGVRPVLSFYRSRFRLVHWQISDGPADYYVVPEAGAGQMVVLHRDGGIVLCR